MAGDLDFAAVSRSLAAQRAAEALIQALGAGTVHLRLASFGVASGDAGQLGIAGAATEDVPVSPVVIRSLKRKAQERQRYELLVAPGTLLRVREIADVEAARELFLQAVGVILEGRLSRVESFAADEFAGRPYLYRVTLAE